MQADSTDAKLVLAARRGDKAAFAALLDRHSAVLLALCRRMLGDAPGAEDAAHEAILQALLALDTLRRPQSFGPWLCGIGLNVCRRSLRERARECWSWEAMMGGRYAAELRDGGPGPEAQAELAELAGRVRRAVHDLPEGQRAAVLLFYLSGLTYAETASLLGIEVGAVKARLHKARQSLRQQLWSVWREETMTAETGARMIDMRITNVKRVFPEQDSAQEAEERAPGPLVPGAPNQPRHVVVLDEIGGERKLLVWVGPFEGVAIALLLRKAAPPRPLTYSFLASVLHGIKARVREVRVTRLADEVFYAETVLDGPDGSASVDARPSDAFALALTVGAPIRVDNDILDRCQVTDGAATGNGQPERFEGAEEIAAEIVATWRK